MLRKSWWAALALGAAVGCTESSPTSSTTGAPATDTTPEANANPTTSKTSNITLTVEETDQIKKLPPGEQTLALAQKICPVGVDDNGNPSHLGSMGKPFRTEVRGRTVFLCCKGCLDELHADPDTYLAKLPTTPKPDEPGAKPAADEGAVVR